MEYGGKPLQKDKNGDTPLSLAKKQTPAPAYLAALQGQPRVAGNAPADAGVQQAQARTKRNKGGNRPR